MSRLTSSTVTSSRPTRSANQAKLGSARGQQELVGPAVLDHAVLQHEAALVEPGRVVGVPRRAAADVARQHAGQEPLGVPARDAVLVERRGVEDAGAVADREVLELVRRLVARHDHVAGPVLPEPGLVERAGPLVEGRRADHRGASIPGRWATGPAQANRNSQAPKRQADADGGQPQRRRSGDQPPVAGRHAAAGGHAAAGQRAEATRLHGGGQAGGAPNGADQQGQQLPK